MNYITKFKLTKEDSFKPIIQTQNKQVAEVEEVDDDEDD